MTTRSMEKPIEIAKREIRELLESLGAGDPLPSQKKLAELLDVPKSSVARAEKALVREGLLISREGWGMFKQGWVEGL